MLDIWLLRPSIALVPLNRFKKIIRSDIMQDTESVSLSVYEYKCI